jgi:protein-S-isoprenylcysteine O-methyltransferase Ste14
MPSLFRRLLAFIEILLAMSGIVLRRMTFARGASILLSLALYVYLMYLNSLTVALWYFSIATLIHYVLLFGMFAPNGWSRRFIARYGEEEGFRRYEALMAFVFFHNGASTALACTVSAGALYAFAPSSLLVICGIALSCVGLPTKVWATDIVGIDTYYYRDLFLRRPVGEFRVAGPYKVFRNPMYGVGHLHGYGSALASASLLGLVLVAINQTCVWLFYWTVEKPHIEAVYGKQTHE